MENGRPNEMDSREAFRRIRLALSLLQQRPGFDLAPADKDAVILALLGATIDEIRQLHTP